ncbi:MAG TPA: tetratricopeptide repeat protein [bacterium]|nr:tetratricopeptide repeat protein [bacterium]
MIWLVILLAVVLPEDRGGLADTLFLLITGGWFVFRLCVLVWHKIRDQKVDIPHVTWAAFSLVILFFASLATYGSICQHTSFTALRLVVANALVFVAITEVGKRAGVGMMLLLTLIGLLGTLIPLSPLNRWVHRFVFSLPHGSNLLDALLGRSGLLTLVFLPPTVYVLLLVLSDLSCSAPVSQTDATGCETTLHRIIRKMFSSVGIVFTLCLWFLFAFTVAWGNPKNLLFVTLPAALVVFGTARIGASSDRSRRAILLALTIFLSVALAHYSTAGFVGRLVLETLKRSPGLSLGIQMAEPSIVRASVDNLPAGTGLGTLEDVLPQYRQLGQWRLVWGGAYRVIQAEMGWTWLAVAVLLFSAALASFVERCLKMRKAGPDWRLGYLGSLLVSLLMAGFADVRVHLLLCPLVWIILGALVAWRPAREKEQTSSQATAGSSSRSWVGRHLLVVTRSFLLSLLLMAFVVNLHRSIRNKVGDLHFNRAAALVADPESRRAAILTELVEASEWSPLDSRIDYEIARTFLRAFRNPPSSPGVQERQNARLALDTAIAKCPLRADYRGLLGQVLFLEGDTAGALQMYQSAIQVDPLNALWRQSLADLYETMGNLPEAERHLRVLCDLLPFSGEARYNLARVLERQGWKQEALSIYRAAMEVQPGYLPAFDKDRESQY